MTPNIYPSFSKCPYGNDDCPKCCGKKPQKKLNFLKWCIAYWQLVEFNSGSLNHFIRTVLNWNYYNSKEENFV